MQPAEIHALRDDMRAEIRRMREETSRELRRLEARLDRMDDRRFADWQAVIKVEAILIWLLAVGLFVVAGTQA
ncbi:MAG TPA: hypothetical protein VNO20_00565 [Solirubrobacterales bacterium]|nr:hypothetical protein [Solirubrobacterales bacterium]